MAVLTARAPDIACEGCASAITRALGRLEGIRSVTVAVAEREVRVEYDEATVGADAILERLARAGYESTLREIA